MKTDGRFSYENNHVKLYNEFHTGLVANLSILHLGGFPLVKCGLLGNGSLDLTLIGEGSD
jgi:hypothetical protein